MDYPTLKQLFLKKKWTNDEVERWQKFYDTSSRLVIHGVAGNHTFENLTKLPEYKDLEPPQCQAGIINNARSQADPWSFLLVMGLLARFFIQ